MSCDDALAALPLPDLLARVRACTLCASALPHEPRPVVQMSARSRILVVGQAPGRKVHETGLPFNDPSGDRLRSWMGIDRDTFYDDQALAILPMGFCYPGKGRSGDLPPRPECAPAWRDALLARLTNVRLTLLIGQYAHAWHLGERHRSVTETVEGWQTYWPDQVPLPHPSPRNQLWLKRHPWFEETVVPRLQARVAEVLASD